MDAARCVFWDQLAWGSKCLILPTLYPEGLVGCPPVEWRGVEEWLSVGRELLDGFAASTSTSIVNIS